MGTPFTLTKSESTAGPLTSGQMITYTLAYQYNGYSLKFSDSYDYDTAGSSSSTGANITGYDGTTYSTGAGTWTVTAGSGGDNYLTGNGGGNYPQLLRSNTTSAGSVTYCPYGGGAVSIYTVEGDLEVDPNNPCTKGCDASMVAFTDCNQNAYLVSISVDPYPSHFFIQKVSGANYVYNNGNTASSWVSTGLPAGPGDSYIVNSGEFYTVDATVQPDGTGGVSFTLSIHPQGQSSPSLTYSTDDKNISDLPFTACGCGEVGWQTDNSIDEFANLKVLAMDTITNGKLTDPIPPGVTYQGASTVNAGTTVTQSTGANALTWTYPSIPPLTGTKAITWWGTVSCASGGTVTNTSYFNAASGLAAPVTSNAVTATVNCPTNTPTWTPTNTPTYTPTPTLTPTYTPTVTPTNTFTPTLTFTPTYTPTPTPTNTYTPTYTPTVTLTITPTYTPTVTPTWTWTPQFSPTPTDTFTPTLTFTPTNTITNTNTPTVTLTVTPTNTWTWTITVTDTFTPTPSFTFTPTPTPTLTVTPTWTPTLTCTPTPTNTWTPSPTFTPTVTPTFTPTITLTVTPSPTPLGAVIEVGVYNSAGELVFQFPVQNLPGQGLDVELAPNGPITSLNSSVTILVNGQPVGTWNGVNADGTPVSNGQYYVKVDQSNSGVVTSATQPIVVNRDLAHMTVNVYNEAGEIVAHLLTQTTDAPGTVISSVSLSTDVVQPHGSGSDSQVVIKTGSGQVLAVWNGCNDQGQALAGGTYYIEIDDQTGVGDDSEITEPVAVLAPSGNGGVMVAEPNEVPLSQPLVLFTDNDTTSVTLKVSVYDLDGELVKTLVGAPGSNQATWDSSYVASGFYIARVSAFDSANQARGQKILRILVVH